MSFHLNFLQWLNISGNNPNLTTVRFWGKLWRVETSARIRKIYQLLENS